MVFIKEYFERVDFGEKISKQKPKQHSLHAKSVSLKCVFFN